MRKKVDDIRHTLPPGIIGTFFNDEFGDTYTAIYAFSDDGFAYAELKTYADAAQQQLLRVKDVEKVDLIGEQAEKIFIEFSDKKLAELNLDARQAVSELQAQNAMLPAGTIVTPLRNIPIRMTGQFQSEAGVRGLLLRINGRTLRVGDFASVRRGYVRY